MSSSTSGPPASTHSDVQEVPLTPPRPFFVEHLGSSDNDEVSVSPPARPPRLSASGRLRPQDRQGSSISIAPSGMSIPGNPFATPTIEAANPFSPPASVVSFSLVDAASAGFRDLHQRASAQSNQSSVANSATDLQQRHSTVREAFTSPPPRPLTVVYPAGHQAARMRPSKRQRPASTMLTGPISKPWVGKRDSAAKISYILTYSVLLFGIAASAVRCYFGWRGVPLLGRLCLVLEDNFDGSELDSSVWMREADMGGFGNGEFEMATTSTNNSFVRDGQLYILPTLTSDVIGQAAIFDGHTFNLTGCTNTNLTACGAVSNSTTGAVINPVMSARISTKGKRSIRYGRVEVRAKLPRGDWLWPAIWMLPENNTYGPWPLSGEIDIMESRGNSPSYPAQGINYVRGSLNWGPLTWLNAVAKTYGWWRMRRSSYGEDFHDYAVEWSEDFLRIYVDNRLQHMLDLRFNIPFFQRGDFPASVSNASQEIILENPWSGRGNAAPFDQPFYLILNVAVGGTNGWFPDGAGDKPWLNGAINAMQLFAQSQNQWSKTWPESEDDRAMRVDYVRMWEQC